jgi:hypothetical protein
MKKLAWLIAFAALGCGSSDSENLTTVYVPPGDASGQDASLDAEPPEQDSAGDVANDTPTSPDAASSCGFDYGFKSVVAPPQGTHTPHPGPASLQSGVSQIAYADPPPPSVHLVPRPGVHPGPEDIVMPDYHDNMPLFERGQAWSAPTRCYETPVGVKELTEPEAYEMYKSAAELTTGVAMLIDDEVRTVVGIRGAVPGTFAWHGNTPNYFNDTLVLLWKSGGTPHVREFPVNTDTGAVNFGVDSSSSLRANRRYHHVCGVHNTYSALHVDETGYAVADDTNHNGHWDSDRNGWLPPDTGDDHGRAGSGHNIHTGEVDGPLSEALVQNHSAGCQVIPGIANWKEFIVNAWTQTGDKVQYFLLDARDIAPQVWTPCAPDGSHTCPYEIGSFPFTDSKDTSTVATSEFGVYNCSTADESGAEVVYVLTVDSVGTLTATVDYASPVDVDVHLLDGDDKNACLARDDKTLTWQVTPGRYFIIVDTYTNGGVSLAGAYTLHVQLQ